MTSGVSFTSLGMSSCAPSSRCSGTAVAPFSGVGYGFDFLQPQAAPASISSRACTLLGSVCSSNLQPDRELLLSCRSDRLPRPRLLFRDLALVPAADRNRDAQPAGNHVRELLVSRARGQRDVRNAPAAKKVCARP